MVPILVKIYDVRSGRKANARHGRLRLALSQWVKVVHGSVYYWTVQYGAKTIWAQVIAMACGI